MKAIKNVAALDSKTFRRFLSYGLQQKDPTQDPDDGSAVVSFFLFFFFFYLVDLLQSILIENYK